jgi:glycosyltransferase involved in cell wall biosynthesis
LSNAGSLPEIGGDAACYFDPQDPVSLIQVLEPLIMEDKLRTDYIRKGRERVSEFSWKKTAEETKKVYQNVLNRS